jgi:putative flippase GtrA
MPKINRRDPVPEVGTTTVRSRSIAASRKIHHHRAMSPHYVFKAMALLRQELIRFGIVGSIAFLIDASILAALVHWLNWSPFSSRVVSMGIAILFTWRVHRHWTFADGRIRPALHQSVLHGTFQLIAVSMNYAVFSALVLTGGVWCAYPALAVVAGSLSAMVVSYLLSKRITFADPGGTPE